MVNAKNTKWISFSFEKLFHVLICKDTGGPFKMRFEGRL